MRLRASAAVVAVSLTFLVQPAVSEAAGAAACARSALATLPGTVSAEVHGVAPGGRFQVGVNATRDGQSLLVRWDGGVPGSLGMSADDGFVNGVNDDGQVIGGFHSGPSWRLRGGAVETLPAPTGFVRTSPVAVNGAGQVAGVASDSEGRSASGVRWSADNQPQVLALPDGYNDVRISGIDEDGTVVGTLVDWDWDQAVARAERAAYWTADGAVNVLPAAAASWTSADAVRNGVAAGMDGRQAVTWRLGSGEPGTPVATLSSVLAINARGSVLSDQTPYLLFHDPVQGIRELLFTGSAEGGYARGLTDGNQVYGTDRKSQAAVRWDCS